jgi:protein-S-isoprenylcysteine O-methyltransferase Ste14
MYGLGACHARRMWAGRIPQGDHGGPPVGWLVAGYAGLTGFLVLEGVVRERGSASSLEDSTDDQGTTRLILSAYALAAVLPLLLRPLRLRRLPRSAGPVGLAIEAMGLGVRLWSMRTLRGSYSRTLGTTEEQQVIDEGPYRLIRHPGYLGSLLTWAGCSVASGSLPTVNIVTGLLAGAYRRRITVEEQLLGRDLPGYLDYSKRTKKVIPLVW